MSDHWADHLRQYLATIRVRDPIPSRASLSLVQEMQLRVIGGHFVHWLQEWGPRLIAERNALPMSRGDTDTPLVVLVTDTPGLVAAVEILGAASESVVFCRRSELEEFPECEADAEFRVHCELHSYFEDAVAPELEARARGEHPAEAGEDYWLHYDCSVMGPSFARGARHLWLWDGREPRLLEEAWVHWTS